MNTLAPTMNNKISRVLVKKFIPLNRIADQHLEELMDHCDQKSVSIGGIALKQRDNDQYKYFLIRGKIEVRRSFHERVYLDQDSVECLKPLNELLSGSGVVRAKSNCQILRVDNVIMEKLLSWSVGDDYQIAHLEEGDSSLDYYDKAIDDDYESDWTETFLQSPLAISLTTNAISDLFRRMEDVEVSAGQVIIEQHKPGDYFYIIKEGEAVVTLDVHGPQKGETVYLPVGRYFGDEALIADTPRNASVSMRTDGVLGRLDREMFDDIVKTSLIHSISAKEVAELNARQYKCIDVRFPIEYNADASKLTQNIPITHLRQKLESFDSDLTYIVGPISDKRSELGTYLLRQAGFSAYCLV